MTAFSSLSINWNNFDVSLEGIALLAGRLGPEDFPRFLAASGRTSERAEDLYRAYLGGSPTPAGKCVKRPSGAVAKSIKREETSLLTWTISNASPVAKALEEGTPERDMKEMLPTSKRARRAKDGTLYLIVPFRHGTPGARGLSSMPQDVYDRVVKFRFSKNVSAPATRVSGTGYTVPRWFYHWQDKLDAKTLRAMGLDEPEVKKYSGMHRMGRRGQTSYLTFRVLSQKSRGWIRPAVPGFEPLRYAVDGAIAENMERLQDAFEADLAASLGLVWA